MSSLPTDVVHPQGALARAIRKAVEAPRDPEARSDMGAFHFAVGRALRELEEVFERTQGKAEYASWFKDSK